MGSSLSFKEKLDNVHKWPCEYMFKFVVPSSKAADFGIAFSGEEIQSRPSRSGNYVAYTIKKWVHSSDEVIAMYNVAGAIDGLIAL